MAFLQNMAIKHKLISIIMLACITGLVLAGATFIGWEYNSFRKEMVRNLSTQAEMIAENCKAALAFGDAEDAKQTLQALHVEPSIVFGCVYNKENKLFASYYRDYAEIKVHPSKFQEGGFSFAEGFLTVFKPIVLDGQRIGTVCLRSDMSPMYAMLKRNIGIIVIVIFLSSLAAFLVSSRLQKVISGPILSLAEVAKAVSGKKDYSTRAIKQSNDEVGLLIDAFNEMLEQIQQRDFELVGAKDQLEMKVEQRTAELTTTNKQLIAEVAERRQAEVALRRSEERFKQVAESAGDWIWEISAEGVYTYSSPIVEKLLGYKPEEIVGKKYFYDLFAPEVKEDLKKAAFETFAKRESFKGFINPNMHKNGSTVILETTGVPVVDDEGNLYGYRGVDRDITEREKAEKIQAELIEEIESVNRELRDFAYVVSHDLKAPLRGIDTLAKWILADYADKFDQEGKEQMDLLLNRVERMHNLIDGILHYSRIGRVKEEKTEVDLNELVPDIIDILAPPENITITIENELPVIECEATRITQVFQNLLSNAVKYIDKPQGRIRVGCVEEESCWQFSVTDNGPGIEERYFEKIFQMFQTLSPRDEVESTGVGLTVVKKIVEMYGGRIWVESKVGEGSVFLFTLPKQMERVKDEKLQACII